MIKVFLFFLLLLSQPGLTATVDPTVGRGMDRGINRQLDKPPASAQKSMQLGDLIYGVKPVTQRVQAELGCGNPVEKVAWQDEKIYEMQIAGSLFTSQSLSRISTFLTSIRLNTSKPKRVTRRKATFARCKGGCCYPCDAKSPCSSSKSCSSYSL